MNGRFDLVIPLPWSMSIAVTACTNNLSLIIRQKNVFTIFYSGRSCSPVAYTEYVNGGRGGEEN